MNNLVDLKGFRVVFVLVLVFSSLIVVWLLGLKTINYWNEFQSNTFETVVKTAAKEHSNIAPTLLSGIEKVEMGELKINSNEMIYSTTDTYESLLNQERVSDENLKSYFLDWTTKIVTFWTTKAWDTYVLKKDGTGKRNESFLQAKEIKGIGTDMSALGVWPFTKDKANDIIKEYFPRASKVSLGDDKYLVVMEMVWVRQGTRFSRGWAVRGAWGESGTEHGWVNNWNPTNWTTSWGIGWGSTSTEDPLGLGWTETGTNENDEGNYIGGFASSSASIWNKKDTTVVWVSDE